MTDNPLSLLIVDDNQDNRYLVQTAFEDEYTLHTAESGEQCLAFFEEDLCDLVLLDVNMPNMDGYEVCRRLRTNPKTALIPVVFVSALVTIEDRLAGYEAGGDDYITKPFELEKLQKVVVALLEQRVKQKNAEKQSKEAMSTAFQAMTNSSELGSIIQFMRDSYVCNAIDMLAQKLLTTLSLFGLNSCVMIRADGESSFYGCSQDSLESKVLRRFSNANRIIDFGARTLLNDEHVSILIKNMPLDRPEDYGRIKDNLAALISGAEARCKAIEVENHLDHERKHGIKMVLDKSQEKLEEINKTILRQRDKTNDILVTINDRIESIVFGLGLDEQQEDAFITAIGSAVEEVGELTKYSDEISSDFKAFVADLELLIKR